MDMNLEVLKYITEIAVKEAGYRDYKHADGSRTLVWDADMIYIPAKPRIRANELLTLDDVVKIYQDSKDGAIWINRDQIVVSHDEKERLSGVSTLNLVLSPAAREIRKCVSNDKPVTYTPDQFERICKLYFLADAEFIKMIRNLKWRGDSSSEAKITAADKSMSASAIRKVLDASGKIFEDILLVVKFPFYVAPIETEPVTVQLNVVANADTQTFCFEPFPGAIEECERKALCNLKAALEERLTTGGYSSQFVYFGSPTSALSEE